MNYKDQMDNNEKYSRCMEELQDRFQVCCDCGDLAFDSNYAINQCQGVEFSCYDCLADWADQDMAEDAWLHGDF